jgi:hypothetical protein
LKNSSVKLVNQQSISLLRNLQQASRVESSEEIFLYLRQHFDSLLHTKGDLNLSIYDLAWVLRSQILKPNQANAGLKQIASSQNSDGSWGDASILPHSALVDSLAVLLAYLELKIAVPNYSKLRDSLECLCRQCMNYPFHDTVAFELIVPSIMDYIEKHHHSLNLASEIRSYIQSLREKIEKRLKGLRSLGGVPNTASTLSFTIEAFTLSSEMLPEDGDLSSLMLDNGAIGLSPAATAAIYYWYRQREKAIPAGLEAYIRNTYEDYEGRGFPSLHPLNVTRNLWNLMPLILSGVFPEVIKNPSLRQQIIELYRRVERDSLGRVAWDTHNIDLPDLDDTATAYCLYHSLSRQQIPDLEAQSLSALLEFQNTDGTIFCYPNELHPSIGALLHTVLALDLASETDPDYDVSPQLRQLHQQLLKQIDPDGKSLEELGHDKWHGTWAYGIQRWLSVPSIQKHFPQHLYSLLDEILACQKGNGWGQNQATVEDTSYVVLGLWAILNSKHISLSLEQQRTIHKSIQGASKFLNKALRNLANYEDAFPPIWISKNLYIPYHQVISSVMIALFVCKESLSSPHCDG